MALSGEAQRVLKVALADSGVASEIQTALELTESGSVTPGTVTASKAVVVDSSKNIGDFGNLDCVNLDCGVATGTMGSVDIFPATASKGKLNIIATASSGDTTTTLTHASQAGARIYTIPDAGASASFVMTKGAQTITGTKTITTGNITNVVCTNLDAGAGTGTMGFVDIFPATASKGKIQIIATANTGDTTMTITHAAQGGAYTYTIPNAGASCNFVMSTGNQSVGGTKTFNAAIVLKTSNPTAAGSGRTTGTAITLGCAKVEGADGTTGVTLPAAVGGKHITILNPDAQHLHVYAAAADSMEGTVGGGVTQAPQKAAIYVAGDDLVWLQIGGHRP